MTPDSTAAPDGASNLTTKPDADILAAFEARAGAYIAYLALPLEAQAPDDLVGKVSAEEDRLMAEVDEAEKQILAATATSALGAECQLWCALSHFLDDREGDARSYVTDFRYFEQREADLDWMVRLVFAGIRSLRAMGGAA